MYKKYLTLFLSITILIVSCSIVPITGRRQLTLIPETQMFSMSYQEYNNFLKTNKLSSNKEQTEMIKRVGRRIQKGVEQYFSDKNLSDKLDGFQWEFNLVESKEVNAWCMPGGKVVFYTGILPYTKNETGIAVVMGHEIAHAVAKHGTERMSQGLLVEMGGLALSEALKKKPQMTQQLWMAAFGLGSQVGVLLPYSRLHENEADHLGLIFMAIAGYDPNAAVDFWKRMSEMNEGKSPLEFLSTHPSDETRISNLEKLVPEAMVYYKKRMTTLQ